MRLLSALLLLLACSGPGSGASPRAADEILSGVQTRLEEGGSMDELIVELDNLKITELKQIRIEVDKAWEHLKGAYLSAYEAEAKSQHSGATKGDLSGLSRDGLRIMDDNLRIARKAGLPENERIGIEDLNLMRLLVGQNALRIDLQLCEAARGHSEDMKTLGFFAHDSPVAGKATPSARAARAGTTGGDENIYMGSRSRPLPPVSTASVRISASSILRPAISVASTPFLIMFRATWETWQTSLPKFIGARRNGLMIMHLRVSPRME